MDLIRIGLLMCTGLMLIACESPHPIATSSPTATIAISTVTAVPTTTMRPPQTSTSTPARSITPTPRPTKVQPTPIPSATLHPPGVPSGVSIPQPAEAILAENVTRVTELARWGKGTISDVAFSADGKTLIVVSSLGIFLHDARSLAEKAFIPLEGAVRSFAISPDGKMMAGAVEQQCGCNGGCGCSREVSVKLWLTNDPAESREIPQHGEYIDGLTFSSDGATLLLVDERGVAIWRVQDMMRLLSLEGKNYRAIDTMPPSNSFVVGVEYGLQFITYDGRLLDEVRLLDGHGWESMTNIAYGGQTVASIVVENGDVHIWHLPISDSLQTGMLGSGHVAVSPDGTRVAAGYRDGWVRLYQASDGKLIRTLKGHDIGETWAVFSPDGATLVTASHDGVIRLWRASDGEFLQSLPGHANPAPVPPVVFNQEVLASASGRTIQIRRMSDGSITQMFEVPANGNQRAAFEAPEGRIINLALSPDGSILASGMDDGLIHLWRVEDGILIKTLDNGCTLWRQMEFSPDGQLLATKGYWLNCLTAHLLRVSDGQPMLSFDLDHRSLVDALVTFTPDGYNAVVTNNQGLIEFRRITDGIVQRSFKGHHDRINDLVFSSDGRLMATASHDRSTRFWDVASGDDLLVLEKAVAEEVVRLVFSPQNDLLVTASSEGTLEFWRVADGALVYVIQGVNDVNSLGFPSDKLLLTSSGDGTVRLWGVPANKR